MTPDELSHRTKQLCLEIIRFFNTLPKTPEAQIIGKQLLRSATSIGANYRAARRARSRPEFYAKLSIIVEESDETLFWLELIDESGIRKVPAALKKEVTEILYIFSASRKSAKIKSLNH